MDTIAICWKSSACTRSADAAIKEAGFHCIDMSNDIEVTHGIKQCMGCLGLEEIRYLAMSSNDKTSNSITLRMAEELMGDREPMLLELANQAVSICGNDELWLLFAHDWPENIEVTYLEGSPESFSRYIRLNDGVFRSTYSFRTQSRNLDLDTPLVWKLLAE